MFLGNNNAARGIKKPPTNYTENMKDNFPSILGCLDELQQAKVCFVRPTVGHGIKERYTSSDYNSPATKVMAVWSLELGSHHTIPFHCYRNKEEIYIFGGGGHVDVFISMGANIAYKFTLTTKGDTLIIPPGRSHAVYYAGILPVEILVISSSQDPEIEWEPGIDELLKNEHLCFAD